MDLTRVQPPQSGVGGAPGYLSRGYVSGGYVSRGYLSPGYVSRGYVSRGYVSRGYVSGGYVSGGYVSRGYVSANSLPKIGEGSGGVDLEGQLHAGPSRAGEDTSVPAKKQGQPNRLPLRY